MAAATKVRTTVTLDPTLLSEARSLGINVSNILEGSLRDAVKSARAKAWLTDNRRALESWGAWVEENGLPLAKYRQF